LSKLWEIVKDREVFEDKYVVQIKAKIIRMA